MDKELQDKAWNGLPQEAKDFFLACYNDRDYELNMASHIAGMLDHVFGEHNLNKTQEEEAIKVNQDPTSCINFDEHTRICRACGQLCWLDVTGYECPDYSSKTDTNADTSRKP